MREFEKISFEQFAKDVCDDRKLYDEYELPQRGTAAAVGYDIFLLEDLTIKPGEIKKLPTGIKAQFQTDEALLLLVRSRMGFKYNIRLCNQVGVIDADYYNNQDNEGHMWFRIQNEGDQEVTIPKGNAVIQGVFIKYLTTVSDRKLEKIRNGKAYIKK